MKFQKVGQKSHHADSIQRSHRQCRNYRWTFEHGKWDKKSNQSILFRIFIKIKFRFHPVKFSPPQSKLVSLWNKLVLLQTPPSAPKPDFLVVKSTVLWLVLVRSRVKPQRLMLKKRRRLRPAVPRDVCK